MVAVPTRFDDDTVVNWEALVEKLVGTVPPPGDAPTYFKGSTRNLPVWLRHTEYPELLGDDWKIIERRRKVIDMVRLDGTRGPKDFVRLTTFCKEMMKKTKAAAKKQSAHELAIFAGLPM
jgi:hypothetical protein